MYQVWRAKFTQLGETFSAAFDRFLENLLGKPGRMGKQGQYQQSPGNCPSQLRSSHSDLLWDSRGHHGDVDLPFVGHKPEEIVHKA